MNYMFIPIIHKREIVLALLAVILTFGFTLKENKLVISVKNKHNLTWNSETITIPFIDLNIKADKPIPNLLAKDLNTGTYSRTQWIDQDCNGIKDALIFQVNIPPYSERKYELVNAIAVKNQPDTLISTFSRLVPERNDDYAWENDRVAFRTYGPEAERLVNAGELGGTLSSGIDCWLKRVSYPIINKWYKMDIEGMDSYHTDHGEGLDNYQVGNSRGCGGIGFRSGDSLYVSNNFINNQTMETGTIRTDFELKYKTWKAGEGIVNEKKRISLDLGSNLSRIEIQFAIPYPDEIVAGLAIPEKEAKGGNVHVDRKAGWFSFWSEHDDSELGLGIVADPKYISGYSEYRVSTIEKSHLFVYLKPIDGKVIYYSGFGWKKSGQFETEESWINYLTDFAATRRSELEINVLRQ